jgi:hypothetical protein
MQQSAVQHLQAIFDMPAADSSTDAPETPHLDSSSRSINSSSSQPSDFMPVWMSKQELQQLAANQPRSSAAYGSTRLCSGAGAVTFHPQLTLPYGWLAQPAVSVSFPPVETFTADSISSQSRTAVPAPSSSSKVEVDLVDSNGSTQTSWLLDPLSSIGVLFEDSQDFSGPGAAAAVAAERDEAYAAMR